MNVYFDQAESTRYLWKVDGENISIHRPVSSFESFDFRDFLRTDEENFEVAESMANGRIYVATVIPAGEAEPDESANVDIEIW